MFSNSIMPRVSRTCRLRHSHVKILSLRVVRGDRQFSRSTYLPYPRKDSQHKDSMNVEANEYSKSGTDDQAARHDETAYDPSNTDPDTQRESVGADTGVRAVC